MLCDVLLSVIQLHVVLLSVIRLHVVLQSVIQLDVVWQSSSSSVVLPSDLHSYVKRRFSGPPFPPPSDSGNLSLAF